MTDDQLARDFPLVPWREPLLVTVPGAGSWLCCRFCIAQKGLKAGDLGKLSDRGFDTPAEFEAHLAKAHPSS